MIERYNPLALEAKWQARWAETRLYEVHDDPARPKWYALVMFPYPSGDLHIGHWYNFGPADAHARYMRMRGYNVLEPIGFDAFGLPAENAAIKRGVHPYMWTMGNIERMRQQLRSIGTMYDWTREVVTCDPGYYRWNQGIFLKFLERGLAYRGKAAANWCPNCATVLANEQVLDGCCERCDTPVTKRDLEQWFLRITAYAEELLDFSGLQWPDKIIAMQRNWIGKSHGVEIAFRAADGSPMPVFTTRPDTVYGVSFMVLAPEHPLVEKLTAPERRAEVQAYVEAARRQTEIERLAAEREKTGVPIGADAINPLNGQRVPIWIADYVLLTYGTGAVMGVPAHDTRDFEFAKKYGLPIPVVIAPPDWRPGQELAEAYLDEGTMVSSGPFDGLPSAEGWQRIADHAERHGLGKRMVQYRMRDWLISRQRYWGTPIPVVYCPVDGIVPVPEDQLPVLLPPDAEFKPTGESPLVRHKGFVNTACPRCGRPARRETDTMDTFLDSSWYFLRYLSPSDDARPWDPAAERRWMPVDQYMGGAEHAVMHLLYARFFCKALRDVGLARFDEPFARLFNQGIILGEDGEKMSKSRGNVVNPDEYVGQLGADTVRAFLMFIGPWDQGGAWSSAGIAGPHRFLQRVWALATETAGRAATAGGDGAAVELRVRQAVHRTLKKVTEDLAEFRFNTALAALMELTNELSRVRERVAGTPAWVEALDTLLLMLAPMAPHIAEELWERRGRPYSIHQQPWPHYDPALVVEEQVTIVVQVDGRVRDRLVLAASASGDEVRRQALASARVQAYTGNGVAKVIYVPRRLVNIVTQRGGDGSAG
ncbi:MAG: leucine--tRNA ligase [Chloroflexi bacterium]|nr:leucine--tRNA ligase [Chloroflexota bacterium]